MRSWPAAATAVLFAAFCLAYAGDAGHGFIKDDFRWIRETRVESFGDVAGLFERTDGFYRPLVSLTFALNTATFGLAPRAFGLTNLAMALANAALVWLLARKLGLAPGPALVAAGTWAFNFHGINMAILWISGRTALMVTLCALLGGISYATGRLKLAGLCCLLAMLSKEEAVLLPVVFALWAMYDSRHRNHSEVGEITESHHKEVGEIKETHHREVQEIREQGILPDLPDLPVIPNLPDLPDLLVMTLRRTWPCLAALAVYLVLRARTDAFWPADAPSYYRLTFSPTLVVANIVQYMDRAITWAAVAALVTYAASGRQARLTSVETRIVVFGSIWLTGLFAVTVFVPVRSSLYAVLPSVGAALAAGAVASASLRASRQRTTAALTVLAMLPLLLVPIYWRRNERWVQLADLSARVIDQVRATAERHPGRRIVIVDNPSERFNVDSAFGSLWPDAAALLLPAGSRSAIIDEASAPTGALVLRLQSGRLVPPDSVD